MDVKLLHASPLSVADLAIGKCWDKPSKDIGHAVERMHRVGNKNKHASTLEHVNYTFDIDGISRACLQELARHRHQSLSVKSTRYTLKELKEAELDTVVSSYPADWGQYYKFIVPSENVYVNENSILALLNLQRVLQEGVSNDVAKYCMPESYKTSLVSTMNMRALQNFLQLRTSKAALAEIRDLAIAMYNALPHSHRFMFKEFIPEYIEVDSEGQTYINFEEV